jgi:hypothetical protein
VIELRRYTIKEGERNQIPHLGPLVGVPATLVEHIDQRRKLLELRLFDASQRTAPVLLDRQSVSMQTGVQQILARIAALSRLEFEVQALSEYGCETFRSPARPKQQIEALSHKTIVRSRIRGIQNHLAGMTASPISD